MTLALPPILFLISRLLDRHPFIFSIVSTWFLWALSDFIGQKVEATIRLNHQNVEYQQQQRRKEYHDHVTVSLLSSTHSKLAELSTFLQQFM